MRLQRAADVIAERKWINFRPTPSPVLGVTDDTQPSQVCVFKGANAPRNKTTVSRIAAFVVG
eukprot:2859264-Amphidinium_carterae.1